MINTKKVIFFFLCLIIPFLSVYTWLSQPKREGSVKGISKDTNECNLYITNLMPNHIKVGEEYFYYPNIVGCDLKEMKISIEGNKWLSVIDGIYIYGVPTIEDVGVNKVTITVSKLDSVYSKTEYIIVE